MALPRVGISACLLGVQVRYDGGHKLEAYAAGPLGKRVALVSVCPEVEAGMGVPREPVQLRRTREGIRMVGVTSGRDHTDAMKRHARRRVAMLESLGLSGYIFKKNSPSCGPAGVPVHGPDAETSRGLFAAALLERMPDLPVADETDLATRAGREKFLGRVTSYLRKGVSSTPKVYARKSKPKGAK